MACGIEGWKETGEGALCYKAGLVRKCSALLTSIRFGTTVLVHFPLSAIQTAHDLAVHWLRVADLAPTKAKSQKLLGKGGGFGR